METGMMDVMREFKVRASQSDQQPCAHTSKIEERDVFINAMGHFSTGSAQFPDHMIINLKEKKN